MTRKNEGYLNNEQVQGKLRNRANKRELFVNEAIKEWMNSPNGRFLLFWLIDEICNTDGGSFVQNAAQTAFNEGVRAVGIKVRQRVKETTPREFVLAMGEEIQRRAEDRLQKETAVDYEETTDDAD